MNITRREFCLAGVSALACACSQTSAPPLSGPSPITPPASSPATPSQPTPVPQPTNSSLLLRVQQLGNNATRVAYGNNGAARIAINGDINWNFLVDGSVVGLTGGAATEDVSAILVSSSFTVKVQRP